MTDRPGLVPGLRDELITDELAQTLELLSSGQVEVSAVDRAEAIERLGRVKSPVVV